MNKCFSLIAILAFLLQPTLLFLPGVSAQEIGEDPLAPTGSIRYVRPAAVGAGDCSSWTNACGLQTALGAAAATDEIWVQAGTYEPTSVADREATFSLKSEVAVYGGFAGTENSRDQRDWATNVTTLSGDIGASGNNSDNSYHVVSAVGITETATLDGFTITAGNANGGSDPNNRGGGMYNEESSPTLENITFSGNSAMLGGGMYNEEGSPTLENVTFSGNTATADGGGMYNGGGSPMLANVTFSGNSATAGTGGGMGNFYSNPTLADITFSGNNSTYGGGMYNVVSSPALENVTFSGNNASYDGGGMYSFNSNPTLANATFSSNTATDDGGGMFNDGGSPELANVIFSGNTATADGGGMYNLNSSPTLADVTFSGNTATADGGGMYNLNSSPTLTDVIFTSNDSLHGGGMCSFESSPELTFVTFSGNTATTDGGGMYNFESSPALENVTFSGNNASYEGGGMFNNGGSPELANVTFSGNSAEDDGGGMYNLNSSPTLANAILWGNTPDQIFNSGTSAPAVTYSDIQDGSAGTGNINADPLFVRDPSPGGDGDWGTPDDDFGDLRLQLTSPAIDAGDNSAVPSGVLTDLNGRLRFVDIPGVPDTGSGTPPIVDMGAYEAQFEIYLPVVNR